MSTGPLLLPSQTEMAAMDAATIAGGVPAHELMERAGRAVADTIAQRFHAEKAVIVLCGSGHNGGDGYVIARLLQESGRLVHVFAVPAKHEDVAAKRALFNGQLSSLSELSEQAIDSASLIVDALLGTGQKQAPQGEIGAAVRLLSGKKRAAKIVAVDLPTGVDGDSGAVFDPVVRADLTVCIELIKRGLLQYPAKGQCGELIACPIGITAERTEFSRLIPPKLPRRRPDSHKGDYGRVLVIAGSSEMPGAGWLCAHGALSAGAGMVMKVEFQGDPQPYLMPEVLLRRIPDSPGSALADTIESSRSIVVGPGLGGNREGILEDVFSTVIRKGTPTVVDADALGYLARSGARVLGHSCIVTPHPGEAGRLLGVSAATVQANRFQAARELAVRFGCLVVLKGAGTIIHGGRQGWVNECDTPYLATAGSGDVLAGMIGGLLAQGMSSIHAAQAGVYLHGRAGQEASRRSGSTITASSIAEAVPAVLSELYAD